MLDALQDMIATCEIYASTHNLSSSTDMNPNKSKTKCIAFLKSDRELHNIKLYGHHLSWVTSTKLLGSLIHSNENGMVCDLMEKRVAYINKNNELMQEFGFALSDTLMKVNNIFNTAFYGSVLRDLFIYFYCVTFIYCTCIVRCLLVNCKQNHFNDFVN